MVFKPTKGEAPAHLEGMRSGRPKGSRTNGRWYQAMVWGFTHRFHDRACPPNNEARRWWHFASEFPDEVEQFLALRGQLGPVARQEWSE